MHTVKINYGIKHSYTVSVLSTDNHTRCFAPEGHNYFYSMNTSDYFFILVDQSQPMLQT